MKRSLALASLSVLPLASVAHADGEVSGKPQLIPLEEGNIRVGGGLEMSYSDIQKTTISLNPSAEYFVNDRLSLGGGMSLTRGFGNDYLFWSIGPSATYYFSKGERWAAYYSQAFHFAQSGVFGQKNSGLVSIAKLGAEYFITPAVSFGPYLQWSHAFGNVSLPDPFAGRNRWALGAQFSIYF